MDSEKGDKIIKKASEPNLKNSQAFVAAKPTLSDKSIKTSLSAPGKNSQVRTSGTAPQGQPVKVSAKADIATRLIEKKVISDDQLQVALKESK